MKNLFKNLMLVAVAAMAFTACTESNNEVDASVEKVVLNFVAEIDNDGDETRSGFVGSTTDENGTKYQSAWDGTEKLAIFDMSTYNYLTETTINAEGQFSVEFEGDNIPDYIYVCSPASAWSDPNTCTIPAEQTPLANSVDPAAHILNGYVSTTGSELSMQHQVAYGKMTLKDVDFEIARVELNLKGVKYGWDSKDITYTLHNNGSVVDNVFWFTTEPSFAISEFTVTAFDAEGKAVTKTVDVAAAGKTLSFGYGQVSKFSVSGLEAVVAPEPEDLVFTDAYVYDYGYGYNDYYLIFEGTVLGELVLNAYYLTNDDWTISTGVYGFGGGPGYFYNGMYSTYNEIELYGGSVEVEVVDGKYVFTFSNLKNSDGGIVLENATYTGVPDGLQVPDGRTPLATPSVTATAEGNIITLSWGAITGAESYYVFCASSNSISPITTTETTVTIEAAYSTAYEFMVTAQAADADPNYKSSEATYVNVTTEKDPNVFADYVLDYVTVNSNYFEFNHDWHNGSANTKTSLRIYMHADDKGSNFINPGQYTCLGQGANTPSSAGKVNFRYCTDTWAYYYSTANTSATLDVSIENGEYVIIATIDGKTWGYKGMPDGWVAPSAGGEEPENPGEGGGEEPDQPSGDVTAELGTEANPYTFNGYASGYQGYWLDFSDSEDGAWLRMSCNSTDRATIEGTKLFNAGCWYSSEITYVVDGSTYGIGGGLNYSSSQSTITNNNDGTYTCVFKVVYTDGTRYYKYVGAL